MVLAFGGNCAYIEHSTAMSAEPPVLLEDARVERPDKKKKTRCKMKLNEMKENETRRNRKLKYLRK